MGRAGAGAGGGHHSSGGGHHVGHSSGGHRVGSSSGGHHRAGAGTGGLGGAASRVSRPSRPSRTRNDGYMRSGPGMPPPPPRYREHSSYRGSNYNRSYGGNGLGCGGTLITLVLILAVFIFVFAFFNGSSGSSSSSGNTVSTIERTKLDTNNAYISDCIVDELDWFDNESKTESRLQEFWKETGVQPYIILKSYDPNLATDDQKEEWAEEYYNSHFDTENIFLYVYFGEFDADNDVGYMSYVNGSQTSSVMDSEAIEIFWNNIDKNWYSDMSTDDLFVSSFNDTAKTIMKVQKSKFEMIKWLLIFAVVAAAGATAVKLVKQKNQRDKEKAEEERKILETPIHDMAQDDLESKYLQK